MHSPLLGGKADMFGSWVWDNGVDKIPVYWMVPVRRRRRWGDGHPAGGIPLRQAAPRLGELRDVSAGGDPSLRAPAGVGCLERRRAAQPLEPFGSKGSTGKETSQRSLANAASRIIWTLALPSRVDGGDNDDSWEFGAHYFQKISGWMGISTGLSKNLEETLLIQWLIIIFLKFEWQFGGTTSFKYTQMGLEHHLFGFIGASVIDIVQLFFCDLPWFDYQWVDWVIRRSHKIMPSPMDIWIGFSLQFQQVLNRCQIWIWIRIFLLRTCLQSQFHVAAAKSTFHSRSPMVSTQCSAGGCI